MAVSRSWRAQRRNLSKVRKEKQKLEPPAENIRSVKWIVAVANFLDLPDQETFFHSLIRAGVKRFFDFLRNVMISGLIIFLAYRSSNPTLIFIGKCTIYLLVLSLWSYFDPYLAKLSIKTKHMKVGQIASFLLRVIIGLLITLSIGYVIVEIVINIAVGYVG